MITLFNNLDKQIDYAVSQGLSNFKFKNFPAKKTIKFDEKNRFLAFRVPHGLDFSITPNSAIFFNFVQSKIDDPNHPGMDTYIFQVSFYRAANTTSRPNGDADIDPPVSNHPLSE